MKKYITISIYALIAVVAIVGSSCEKQKAYNNEQSAIKAYLEENNYDVEPTYSGLYYIEIEEGTGAEANGGNDVKVKYKGTFLDGEEFDSGTIPFTLGIGHVIKGWDEGISYMKVGGKAKLLIPFDLAYGPEGRGPIPEYTPLLFDVELLEVN